MKWVTFYLDRKSRYNVRKHKASMKEKSSETVVRENVKLYRSYKYHEPMSRNLQLPCLCQGIFTD